MTEPSANIEELRRRVAELEACEERHRALLDCTHDAVFLAERATGRCMQVNRRASELLGYAASELCDMNFADLAGAAQRGQVSDFIERAQPAGQGALQFAAVHRDGSEVVLEARATSVERGPGALVQIVARDMSAERSREFLTILLESVPDYIYFKDENRRFVVASRSFERLLKRAPGEIIGKRDEDLWPPEIGAKAIADDRRVIEQGIPVLHRVEGGEVIDGVECWVSTSKLPWRGPDGSIRGLYGISKDITETRRVQLQQSENRLRQIIDAVFGFVVLCTADGVLIDANRAPIEAAGLALGDVAGKPLWETYWWNYEPAVQERLRAVMMRAARGEVAGCEEQARIIDGALIDLDLSFAPMHAEDGSVDGIIGFAANITERKRAEHALRENEQRLRLALEASGQGTWALELPSMMASYDAQYARILGYEHGELSTQDWQSFADSMHPDDRGAALAAFAAYQNSCAPEYQAEFRLRSKTGDWKWGLATGKFVDWDVDGRPVRMVGTHTDISERKRADELLRASLREKETLLREVHHRVKNNLQIISSLLHFQAKRVTEPEHLAAFEEGRKRLLAMVLVHEKLYQSKELSNIDFGDYVRSLVAALLESSDAQQKFRIDVVADELSLPIESALPSGMILCELLTNVFKYAYPDGRAGITNVHVHVGDAGAVHMSVIDDGVGLPEGFESGAIGSFGWQLIRSLVAQLDGTVRTHPRQGAHIEVRFPLPERPVEAGIIALESA